MLCRSHCSINQAWVVVLFLFFYIFPLFNDDYLLFLLVLTRYTGYRLTLNLRELNLIAFFSEFQVIVFVLYLIRNPPKLLLILLLLGVEHHDRLSI